MIVGQNGNKIKEIRQESDTDIYIDQEKGKGKGVFSDLGPLPGKGAITYLYRSALWRFAAEH